MMMVDVLRVHFLNTFDNGCYYVMGIVLKRNPPNGWYYVIA